MGLYLCVFGAEDGDDELDGVEIGSYGDFGRLREAVAEHLEPAGWGSRFPVFMNHADNDGQWTPTEAVELQKELQMIDAELAKLPPQPLPAGWQIEVAKEFDLVPAALNECFFDVNGDPVLERIIDLCRLSIREGVPIVFQ